MFSLLTTSVSLSADKNTLRKNKNAVISSYDKKSCYQSGDKITITGNGFGTRSGKSIALGGNGIHVDIKNILRWSNTQISAILPTDSKIQAKNYYIGIEQADHGKWLSNISRSLSFCNPPTNPTNRGVLVQSKTINTIPNRINTKNITKKTLRQNPSKVNPGNSRPSNSKPGKNTTTQPRNSPSTKITNTDSNSYNDYEDYDEDDYYYFEDDDYYEEFDYTPTKERSHGSLKDRGLPQAPQVLNKTSASKSVEHREHQEAMVASADMEAAIELASYLSEYNITIKRRKLYVNLGIVISILRVPEGEDVPETINTIRQEIPDLWADENQRYTLLASSNKKAYAKNQIGWTTKHQACSQSVKIGLIDTEIAAHPSLSSQQIIKKSFLSAGITPAPSDHGTAIAGILVGASASAEFQGLLPNSTLYAATVFRLRDKNKIDTTAELIIESLDWLIGEGIKVINLSFGGPRNLILELVLNSLVENGITIVSAAGSNGKNGPPLYPAAQPGVLAVNAIDANQRLFNKAAKGNYIDFSGPGVDVWVASPNGTGKYSSGSSFAAPFITAAAAIIPKDYQGIYEELKKNVSDLGSPGKDSEYGWGLIKVTKNCG